MGKEEIELPLFCCTCTDLEHVNCTIELEYAAMLVSLKAKGKTLAEHMNGLMEGFEFQRISRTVNGPTTRAINVVGLMPIERSFWALAK